jgi:hypothetical protein
MSRANKTRFHLPDGPAQEARDAEWARAGDRSPEALRWLFRVRRDGGAERLMSRPPRRTRALGLLVGVLCGISGGRSRGRSAPERMGSGASYAATGLIAGIVTGIAITAVSTPMYRRASPLSLYWYSPLSVYAAIAIYGLVVLALRYLIGDFAAGQKRWAVGLQSILGMCWGVTVLVPLALIRPDPRVPESSSAAANSDVELTGHFFKVSPRRATVAALRSGASSAQGNRQAPLPTMSPPGRPNGRKAQARWISKS